MIPNWVLRVSVQHCVHHTAQCRNHELLFPKAARIYIEKSVFVMFPPAVADIGMFRKWETLEMCDCNAGGVSY